MPAPFASIKQVPGWSNLHAKVHRVLLKRKLLPSNTGVLIAVSGGQDSVCLAHLLKDLQLKWRWRLGVAHCDHKWRSDSGANAEFVRALAGTWGLPYMEVVASQGADISSEGNARKWRYKELLGLAKAGDFANVVTGHTASDVAETLLFNLSRGAGAEGLSALSWRRPLDVDGSGVQLVRPLLEVTRAETAAACASAGLEPYPDSTNQDVRYSRNRIRLEVLPLLHSHINSAAELHVARTAELLRAESELLDQLAVAALERCYCPPPQATTAQAPSSQMPSLQPPTPLAQSAHSPQLQPLTPSPCLLSTAVAPPLQKRHPTPRIASTEGQPPRQPWSPMPSPSPPPSLHSPAATLSPSRRPANPFTEGCSPSTGGPIPLPGRGFGLGPEQGPGTEPGTVPGSGLRPQNGPWSGQNHGAGTGAGTKLGSELGPGIGYRRDTAYKVGLRPGPGPGTEPGTWRCSERRGGMLLRRVLAKEHLAVQRRVMRLFLQQELGMAPGFETVERALQLLSAPNGSQTDSLHGAAAAAVRGPYVVVIGMHQAQAASRARALRTHRPEAGGAMSSSGVVSEHD